MLVKHFLKLALGEEEKNPTDECLKERFAHILAITFTKKSTNEMKERILSELDKMVANPNNPKDMANDVRNELGIDADELKRRAEIVRSAILHNYSDLSVCTIDSFTTRIARSFAYDLNLPARFDVLLDQEDLVQHASDGLMSRVGQDNEKDLTDLLCAYAEDMMAEEGKFNVEKAILKLSETMLEEASIEPLKCLQSQVPLGKYKTIGPKLRKFCRDLEKELKDIAEPIVEEINQLNVDDNSFANSGAIVNYFKNLNKGNLNPKTANASKFLTGNHAAQNADPETSDAIETIAQDLIDAFIKAEKIRKPKINKYNTYCQILQNFYATAVLNELKNAADQYSTENDIVHISEFNKRVSQIVEESGSDVEFSAPYIYERVGSRYRNFLIDEFQDTSKLQWQNLLPLIQNAIAESKLSLVVGDGKQAIYRFREGDADQFIQLPKLNSGKCISNAQVITLGNNFRTKGNIVDFNNAFFSSIISKNFAGNKDLQKVYIGDPNNNDGKEELYQRPQKQGGYVEIDFFDDKPNSKGNDINSYCERIRKTVLHQVKDCGYNFSDIFILARGHKTLSTISEYFKKHPEGQPIPIVSAQSALLTNSRVVALLRTMLKWLCSPTNRPLTVQALLQLQGLGVISSAHLDHFLTQNQTTLDVILAKDGIPININSLRSLSIYDCCEQLIRDLHLKSKECDYTAAFLNTIATYSANNNNDLAAFNEWFDEIMDNGKISASSAGNVDAVSLLTVHSAKGLERPVVIYAMTLDKNESEQIWVDVNDPDIGIPKSLINTKKDFQSDFQNQTNDEELRVQSDRTNILYVALTRPKDKLIIMSPAPSKSKSSKEPTTNPATMLANFAQSDTGKNLGIVPGDVPDCKQFRLGVDGAKDEDKPNDETTHREVIDNITYPEWTNRIIISNPSKDKPAPDAQGRIDLGNLMHDLLSLVRTPADIPHAVEHYCRHNDTGYTPAELKDRLNEIVTDPQFAEFFSDQYKVKIECTLFFNHVELRPDRIVVMPNETWVVDFKTGDPNASHHSQVKEYCRAITQMGYPNVKGCLLYIKPGEHKKVLV